MSEELTNQTLTEIIKRVEIKIDDGFNGVHKRQDEANHGIKKNRERIAKLENWRWYIIGGGSVFMLGLTLFIKFY